MARGPTLVQSSPSVLPEWLRRLVESVVPNTESQIAATVLILVVLLALAVVNRRAGPVLKQRYDDPVVELCQGLAMLVGLGAAAAAIVVVWRGTDEVARLLGTVGFAGVDLLRTVLSVLLLSLAYTATRLTKRAIHQLGDRRGALTDHQMEISHHVAQVSIYVFGLLVVLGMWGVDVSGLLVGAGFAGIVLGLAARQTLGAVLAGFVVLFSRPFELGDWVVIGDQEGIVTDITIVNTRLRTFDDEVVMIPNDIVTSEEVLNRSRNGRLRINVDVGVDYETDLQRAMDLAEEAMESVDLVADGPKPHVVGKEFGDSAVVLRLRFHIQNPSSRTMWEARTEVITAVKELFEDAGVTIPFPQRELSDRGEGPAVGLGDNSVTARGGDGRGGDGRVEETDSSVDAETGGDDDD